MKKGLVLEGGAMRGLFSAGVIDVLMENSIWPDGTIGVSAGAAFGCNMKSRQAGRVISYNKKLAHDWRYASVRSWITTGDYFGGQYAYHYIPFHVDPIDVETFQKNPMEFWCVCTNVRNGKAHYQKLDTVDDKCLEYIRASASMPMFAKVVSIDGKYYLDGGIADSIPLKFFQKQGYQRNIVVLTQPADYQKEPNKLMPLIRAWLHRYPRTIKALRDRYLVYNDQLAYVRTEEEKGDTLVIRPKEALKIGHISHNPNEMQSTYELGRQAALERIDEIKAFFYRE